MIIDFDGLEEDFETKITEIFDFTLDFLKESKENVSVGVFFTDEEEIRQLNSNYRGIDKITDVLSFPMLDKTPNDKISDFEEFADIDDGNIYLGDIIICKEKALAQAEEYNHSFKREVCFLALHGLLHLLGYDHIEKKDEVIMQGIAKEILEKVKVGRDD